LYAQTGNGDLFRWNINAKTQVTLDLAGVTLTRISTIFSDENVNGRVYIGTSTGSLYRSNGTNTGTAISDVVRLTALQGAISSIDVERGNADHILVTISSYGAQSVWESRDGGVNFTSCDLSNLPDMPVRWGIFNPNDPKSAFIATDLGVWTTDFLNGTSTIWQPPVPARGTPLVRTDRLEWRKSDKMLLAGTYGRGLWTSSVLGKAKPIAEFQEVTYLDVPINFKGENSVSADNYRWLFSDNGAIDTLENPQHIYRSVGKFDVNLTINNDNALKTTNKIQVLPSLPTPYKPAANVYAGGFEDATSDVHFGAWSESGSKWTRGNSARPGKAGTHTGAFAYVLAKDSNTYVKNTTAYLQTPNFDMSKTGIYQFSFWANYDIQQGYDGFKVEYSLDKGISWKQLGSKADADWYNYQNTSLGVGSAFPLGDAYISGSALDWERFKVNASSLAGNANVAFRFVFKSDGDNVRGAGVAIDDVVLTRYDGKLETVIINQSGAYNREGTSINVSFQTQPEYFARTFTLEKSLNGRVWDSVETLSARGISSEELNAYPIEVRGTPLDLYYFRIKSVNNDAKTGYKFTFYSPTFVVNRNKDVPLAVNRAFPSPFTNLIGVTFTDVVDKEVVLNLYDELGRLVGSQTSVPNGVYQELKIPNLAKGIYFLSVKIGDGKPETIKLFGGE
jgi:PKD repeat protein